MSRKTIPHTPPQNDCERTSGTPNGGIGLMLNGGTGITPPTLLGVEFQLPSPPWAVSRHRSRERIGQSWPLNPDPGPFHFESGVGLFAAFNRTCGLSPKKSDIGFLSLRSLVDHEFAGGSRTQPGTLNHVPSRSGTPINPPGLDDWARPSVFTL
jgi:hypothetical protein